MRKKKKINRRSVRKAGDGYAVYYKGKKISPTSNKEVSHARIAGAAKERYRLRSELKKGLSA